jgi:hypothetical protein
MANPQLQAVVAHLRRLAADAAKAGAVGDLAANRRIIDRYCDVDPSVRRFQAEVLRLDVAGVPCEWLLAEGADPDRRLLYVHGGGWTSGGLESHRPLSARISSATGCAVLAVDCRLAPLPGRARRLRRDLALAARERAAWRRRGAQRLRGGRLGRRQPHARVAARAEAARPAAPERGDPDLGRHGERDPILSAWAEGLRALSTVYIGAFVRKHA